MLDGVEQDVTGSDVTQTEAVQENTEDTNAQEAKSSLEYEKGVSLSDKLSKDPNLTDSEIADLEKLAKFKYKGKVLTLKDLEDMEKGTLRQSDYTKKTQEIAQTKKYWDNLETDLANVRNNPQLKEEFLKIYPKQFHNFLSFVDNAKEQSAEPAQKTDNPQVQEQKSDPRLDEVFNWFQEQRQNDANHKVNALFDRLQEKYPEADEGKVISKVQALIEASKSDSSIKRPDDKSIEELFKGEHERMLKRDKEKLSKLLGEQRKASDKGRGPASGGGIPGQAPKTPRTIKEATELALSDPFFQ